MDEAKEEDGMTDSFRERDAARDALEVARPYAEEDSDRGFLARQVLLHPNDLAFFAANADEYFQKWLHDRLPSDLLRVLRDPAIVLDRDREVRLADGRTLHEHLEEWRNANVAEVADVLAKPGTESPHAIYERTGGGEPYRREMIRLGYVTVDADVRCGAKAFRPGFDPGCRCLLKKGHEGDHACSHGEWPA